jgi:hypothetical protein
MRKSKRNDENFNPKKVIYEGEIYETGNRYHTLIELFIGKKFYMTVQMSDVEPITDFQIRFRAKLKSLKNIFKLNKDES